MQASQEHESSRVNWADKARALLLPTPLAALDPEGEPHRARSVCERYGWPLEEPARFEGYRLDAYHIQLGGVEGSIAGGHQGLPQIRHALSGEVRTSPDDRGVWGEVQAPSLPELQERWVSLERRLPASWDASAFREVWRQVCEDAVFDRLAAVPSIPDHSWAAQRSLASAFAGAGGQEGAAMILLHLSPVQSFIQAARRASDLWVGSFTLAFLAFEGARSVAASCGPDAILSPSLAGLPLAHRRLFGDAVPAALAGKAELLRPVVPNQLVALVPRRHAEEIATEACRAIDALWRHFGCATVKLLSDRGWLPATERERFKVELGKHLEHHLELRAIAQPLPATRQETVPLLQASARSGVLLLNGQRASSTYGPVFDHVHGLLGAWRAGRLPADHVGDHRPKCTVCGLREQLGPVEEREPRRQKAVSAEFWRALALATASSQSEDAGTGVKIKEGEGLCGVCTVKRFAPQAVFGAESIYGDAPESTLGVQWSKRGEDRTLLRFPSVASVAAAPVRLALNGQDQAVQTWARDVKRITSDVFDWTPPGNGIPGLGRLGVRGDHLDLDGSWLYAEAYEAERCWRDFMERSPTEEERSGRMKDLEARAVVASRALRSMLRPVDQAPSSYYAVIALDGDRIGDWLTGRHEQTPTIREIRVGDEAALSRPPDIQYSTWPEPPASLGDVPRPLFPALHGELSRRLATLAMRTIPEIVERHLGRLIYSGGDDVLALVPLQTALSCADALEQAFVRELGARVTVSAGVAVSHVRQPLSGALALARSAERRAKDAGRDRFTLAIDKRSGDVLTVTLPWKLDEATRSARLLHEVSELNGREGPLLSLQIGHALREDLTALGEDQEGNFADWQRLALRSRVEVTLQRASSRSKAEGLDEPVRRLLNYFLPETEEIPLPAGAAKALVGSLLAARFLRRELGDARTEVVLAQANARWEEANP